MTGRSGSRSAEGVGEAHPPSERGDRRPPRSRRVISPIESERAAYFDLAAGMTDYLSVSTGAETFLVPTSDRGLCRGLFARRSRVDITTLGRAVRVLSEEGVALEGSVFLDVGANIGTTTVSALRRHSFGSAVSIEAAATTARILRMNLALNDLEHRVRVITAAVGGHEHTAALRLKNNIGASELVASGSRDADSVPVVTVNSLVESGTIDVERLGLVWVDTAGNEAEVLDGASKLVAAQVPLIVRFRPKTVKELIEGGSMQALAASYATATDLRTSLRMTLAEFEASARESSPSSRVQPASAWARHRILFQAGSH
jgi:FkbM family methyltransferase